MTDPNTPAEAPRPPGPSAAADPLAVPWLDAVRFDAAGLVTAVVQEAGSGRVLMVAWMNREALAETVRSGRATYWSRSRGRLWRKGESSGHDQSVREIRLDCDGDTVLLTVEQAGGIACHTGRHSCFFSRLDDGRWLAVDPVLRDPRSFYRESE
jgi:phosphoribosyl-AMP cyclohydrolase